MLISCCCAVSVTAVSQGADKMSSHRPEVILNNFNTRLGHSVGRMLASLFNADPNYSGRRVVTFHNQRDFIFFRQHRYSHLSCMQEVGAVLVFGVCILTLSYSALEVAETGLSI